MTITDNIELQQYKKNLLKTIVQKSNNLTTKKTDISKLLKEYNNIENNQYKPRKEVLLIESKINIKDDFLNLSTLIDFYFKFYKKDIRLKTMCYFFKYYFKEDRKEDFCFLNNVILKQFDSYDKSTIRRMKLDNEFLNYVIRFKRYNPTIYSERKKV